MIVPLFLSVKHPLSKRMQKILVCFVFLSKVCITSELSWCQTIDRITLPDASSVIKSIIEQNLAVQRFDLRMEKWRNTSQSEPDRVPKLAPIDTRSTIRLQCDLEKKRIACMESSLSETQQPIRRKEFLSETRLKCFFENEYWDVALYRTQETPIARKVEFSEFCRKSMIELPHFVGLLTPFSNLLVRPLESRMAEMIDHVRGSAVEVLPDGTLRLFVFDKSKSSRSILWVDSNRWVVTKMGMSVLVDGEWKTNMSCDFIYERVADFDLPVFCSYSRETKMRTVSPTSGESPPADELGTIKYEWFHVNSDEIEFASVDDLGTRAEKWEVFLNPPFRNGSKITSGFRE
jgi:hypothetical protein